MKNSDVAESPSAQEPSTEQKAYIALAAVPPGKVVTYGQLGDLAGLPRAARLIGHILRKLPAETTLPWHRVINAAGKISLGPESDSGLRQRALLQEEGVVFNNGRISLKQFRWQP
jgi:methylated-DNA-protein-cysteine methyltransferase-like protein